jgi:hypothetical protein
MKLPLWITQPDGTLPQHLLDACKAAGEEILAMDALPEDLRENVAGVRCVLLLWSWHYYNGDQQATDDEYDALYRYLQIREARFPGLITPLSPTQRVGKVMA